jgi:hypothetical protein
MNLDRNRRRARRRGTIALEELMILAVMLPLAFGVFWFCLTLTKAAWEIIFTMTAAPIL